MRRPVLTGRIPVSVGQDEPATEPPPEPVPERPTIPGRLVLTRGEAEAYQEALREVLAIVAEAGDAVEGTIKADCVRDVGAGNFRLSMSLHDRLETWLATAPPGEHFTMTHGEATIAAKSADCAERLDAERIRKVATVGAVGAAGVAALLLLL